jgi:gamma-D-glutamyl-L-lysine dipeptidyl-peptidase
MLLRVLLITLYCLLIVSGSSCAAPNQGISKLGYSIQVGAFSQIINAEKLTDRLQEQGIEAFFFKRENGLFAVRFGDFASRRAAEREAKRIIAEQGIDSYFIAPPLKSPLSIQKDNTPTRTSTRPVQKKGREDIGYIAARTAERFIGIPYQWGGCTVVEGMDCSAFVRAVYNLCGVNIPRTSGEQYKVGRGISREELEDGDLVFFSSNGQKITHVGIYVGKDRFVHAPRRGEDIKISSLFDSGYAKKFVGARRYFQ